MSSGEPSSHALKATSSRSNGEDRAERKIRRRRRSRSSDSRKSRKENAKDVILQGKKRKTGPVEDRPPSPIASLEVTTPQSHYARRHKDSFGKSELRQNLSIVSQRTQYVDSATLPVAEEPDPDYRKSRHRMQPVLSASLAPGPHTTDIAPAKDLRQQVIDLKKETELLKQNAARDKQMMDMIKKELAAAKQLSKKQEATIVKLKTNNKKSDEQLSNIQNNLQCQICLELLLKPYALSQCGHVLCLKCLQEWFRSVPDQNQGPDEDEPLSALFRTKTCPCCRAKVFSRPVQLFVVKSMAALFAPDTPSSTSVPDASGEGDPWAGIFPEEVNITDDEYAGEDDDEDNELDGDAWSISMGFSESDPEYAVNYGSESDSYAGEYVRPMWAPPALEIDRRDVMNATVLELGMMKRGATIGMIRRFDMRFEPENGLVAVTDSGNDVYLGYNIWLDEDDDQGTEFMTWVESDIFDRPERWDYEDSPDGSWTAWRLVRQEEASGDENSGDEY
ncbi:hypothetical protein BD410DRAFT_786710 [Rickenella mellea]|uniref:RING-type domain-containing protein n=1 Tax=Rickenella mellea TaxID=50990 RepID=A0A4Y7QA82_9AGAM|nr:hypothetical protein BD410DRAFT_786710 [Rickenella mellea]